MNKRALIAGAAAFALVVAACGSDDDDATTEDTTEEVAESDAAEETSEDTEDAMDDEAMDDDAAMEDDAMADEGHEAAVACDAPFANDGVLTVATGETVFPPWMGAGADDFDDPTTGTGYEGALVFAVADQLGFAPDQVEFVRTGFNEVIAPGEKDWDFNIQQYTITAERDEVVDFSDGYYSARQAIIGPADGPAASATTVAELQELRIGAAIGTTSLDYAEQVIAPSSDVLVFDDNAAAKAAFDAGQVDAIVFDVPTAYFVTAVEITDASIIGVLPEGGEADELGMLFEEGNPLVSCVNEALANLEADGSLDAFEQEWLSQGGDIPTLEG